ncbi:MAG: GspH/FimT family pseudopilin [Pseudomonadota bacterium]|nr:GspH/FimT family pseudopilin [Pseudomonadota bacterium]
MGSFCPLSNVTSRDRAPDHVGSLLAGSRSGHTLVELAVAIAIVGILAGMGWSAIQPEVDRFRMLKAARMLHSDLQSLRAMAIATNRETRIVFTVADDALDPADVQVGEWLLQAGDRSNASVEWDTLPIDDGTSGSEGERSLSPGGADETPHVSLARWPTLVGPGTDNADAIVFSPRGWVANPAKDFADGYVALRIVNKRALGRGAVEEVTLRVSRGGLTRLEVGASTTLPATDVGTGEASSQ